MVTTRGHKRQLTSSIIIPKDTKVLQSSQQQQQSSSTQTPKKQQQQQQQQQQKKVNSLFSSTPNTRPSSSSSSMLTRPSTSGSSSGRSASGGITKQKQKSKSSIITEHDIIQCNNNEDLIELINQLTNTEQDLIFNKYKTKQLEQLENDHYLIKQLQFELKQKELRIESLLQDIDELRANQQQQLAGSYESPIRKRQRNDQHIIKQDQFANELENIGFTLDMIELLTGIKVIHFEEDEFKLYFHIKQSSSSSTSSSTSSLPNEGVFINYQLILSKDTEGSLNSSQINYIPSWLDYLNQEYYSDEYEFKLIENSKYLKTILPEYLCENLSFPFNTLSQFYNKVSKAINKKH